MAARTVRCLFKNLTDQTLVRVREHLDHGIYTDPWFPPETVAPGTVGEWRSESNGFMTGTEGRARYQIANGEAGEFIDLWWDNPFIGGNKSSIGIVQDFTGNPSEAFEGANHIDGAPPPNLVKMADGDIEAWIDAVLAGPLYMFANASSANDANAVFAIRRKSHVSSPLFAPQGSGSRSSRINTSWTEAEWQGLWSGDAVSVTVALLSSGDMNASVTDTTISPTLQFQEAFRLGQPGWAFNAFALGVHQELHPFGRAAASAVIQAASRGLQRGDHDERLRAAVRKGAQSEVNQRKLKIPEERLSRATEAAVAVEKLTRLSVLLSNGVCLTLYDDFDAGQKVGGHMLYERVGPGSGVRLASERLSFYPMLH